MTAPALRLENVSKSFGTFKAIDAISWQVEAGEIHALVGMNGSGKSTLVKVLAGYHDPDPGSRLWLWGKPVPFPLRDSERHGIGIIHQDLGLAEDLTVAENVGLAVGYDAPGLRPVRWRQQAGRARQALEAFGLDIPPHARVFRLGRAERTAVALARMTRKLAALGGERNVLLLDEPTVAFDHGDVERLFTVMRGAAAAGNAVVFISHRLPEVLAIADRVTVIRDGRLVATVSPGETSPEAVIELMLGRRLDTFYPERPPAAREAPVVLELRGLTGRRVRDVTLSVRAGEILGVTGLVGMGQDELPEFVSGLRTPPPGSLSVHGQPVRAWDTTLAQRQGVLTVPADRHRDGLWLEADCVENVTLPVIRQFFRKGRLDHRAAFRATEALLGRFGVVPRDPRRAVRTFSGGNQQKIVMAKTLQRQPKVLVLHQPTVGVDAAARREILDFVCQAAGAGCAVLYVSTEYEELAHMCHRVVVFENGRLTAEITGADVSERTILERCHLG
jgi:ribose transport system ATP-binding protein